LFEESLDKGSLKTAGGYLLVLHTLDELGSSSQQLIRLLQRAKDERDWELCKELARFLMALDESGDTLKRALEDVGLRTPTDGMVARTSRLSISSGKSVNGASSLGLAIGKANTGEGDYFSPGKS
jgi:hypothetical protein